MKLPEKQIAPDKNPIAPKINPSKMKAVGKRELTPIQNKKEPGLGLRTEVVNGITIRIDFLESEKYKTIRAVLEDSIKAFQAKTGAKNFSTFPKDGLALDPTTYEIYLNLVDNKGKVIEKDIGPINASKPFFYATTIKTDDINKNGYKFVCNKVNFKRPNNYKESFFVNNGYKYFMANKIKIVKPGESTSYNPINEASKLYKAVKYEYPKVKPIVMDKVKAGSSYEVSPYGMSLSGETLESCINSGAKKIGTDYDYEISVVGVDKLTWYEIMNYIPKITNPTVMDIMEIEDEYNDLGNNKNKLPEYERVYGMSWFDAIYFCNELSKRDGYTPCYSVNNNTDVKKWGYIPGKGNSIKGSIKCNEKANGYRLPTSNEYDYYQDAFRGAEYHVKGWKSQVEKHNDSGDFYSGHRCYEWFNDNMDKTDLKTVKMPYPGGAEIIEAYNAEEAPTSVYKLHINEHSVMPSAMKVVRTLN